METEGIMRKLIQDAGKGIIGGGGGNRCQAVSKKSRRGTGG